MQIFLRGLAAALLFMCLFHQTGCSRQQELYLDGMEREILMTETASESEEETEVFSSAVNAEDSPEQESGYVFVCGSVREPGVYPMHEGMRVFEAIELAGGFSEGADEDWLNQAENVCDGQRIYVYSTEETMQMSADEERTDSKSSEVISTDQKVNINIADKNVLMTLAGIGEAKADAIIEYREIHGPFQSIDEIQNIPGIKAAVFSKIKDKITV